MSAPSDPVAPESRMLYPIPLYAASIVLLSYYGAQVCPLLEGLGFDGLSYELAIGFTVSLLIRAWLMPLLDRLGQLELDLGVPLQAWRYFLADLALWIFAGALVLTWNLNMNGFPIVASGLKLVVGSATLGFFSASWLALGVERRSIRTLAARKEQRRVGRQHLHSIARRMMIFMLTAWVVALATMLLLINKDFKELRYAFSQQLRAQEAHGMEFKRVDAPVFGEVVAEVCFVGLVLLGGTYMVCRRYADNLNLMFDLQIKALADVTEGKLETSVPVVSADEFSTIARHTNEMIAGLRDRQRIKTAFGKYVSAPVAEAILEQGAEAMLGGKTVEATVLFTDLRSFTTLSETMEPTRIVAILNEYFAVVVGAIHRHGGVLDKFIGDAAMGVFGLQGDPASRTCAVEAAIFMRRELEAFNVGLAARGLPRLETGIGIHWGSLVAGNIGSPDRLEFTVIGDTVNTASRLEGLTKILGTGLAISKDVHDGLPPELTRLFVPAGEHALKGKAAGMQVYKAAA